MPYADFTLDGLRHEFGLAIGQARLFAGVAPVPIPAWLGEALDKGLPLALGSEKARSEFLVAPILLTARDLVGRRISIYSGQRLDGDPSRGLVGECDFLVAAAPPLPVIQPPILTVVGAKKNDIEGGLGQCAAQAIGARLFNRREQAGMDRLYGCTTTGEAWQFLELAGEALTIELDRYYINDVGTILAVLTTIVDRLLPPSAAPPAA